MQEADQAIEDRNLHDVTAGHRQQRAHEHRPDVLDAVGGAVRQQDGAGRGGSVHDSDHGLLRHAPLAAARERKHERADHRREEAGAVRLPRVKLVAEQERSGCAERGDLGERDVDEDDLARQHVDAEIRVDSGENQAHEERRPQKSQEVGEHWAARLAESLSQRVHVVVDRGDVRISALHPADHPRQNHRLGAGLVGHAAGELQVVPGLHDDDLDSLVPHLANDPGQMSR
jgi:hypothetical protein